MSADGTPGDDTATESEDGGGGDGDHREDQVGETPLTTGSRRVNREQVRAKFRESFISGLAVVVPLLITVLVLTIALRSIYQYLDLFSDYLQGLPLIPIIPGVLNVNTETLIELLLPIVLAGLIIGVGFLVNSSKYGEKAVDYFDAFIMEIPGVGSVYESFRQMSDVMLESDAQNFREVKLVEFPHEGAYTLGFVTTETPEPLRRPTGHDEMLTLFLPLAPNPVMGGHLVHLPADRVMDVDMTVEEGLRAVVTSGVAVSGGSANQGLSEDQLRELTHVERVEQQMNPDRETHDVRRESPVQTDRTEQYDQQVSPEWAGTPEDIVRRERAKEEDAEADSQAETDADRDTGLTPSDLEAMREESNETASADEPADIAYSDDGSTVDVDTGNPDTAENGDMTDPDDTTDTSDTTDEDR